MDLFAQSAPHFLYLSLAFHVFLLSLTRLHVFLPIEREQLIKGLLPGIDVIFYCVLFLGSVAASLGILGILSLMSDEVNMSRRYLLAHRILKNIVETALSLYLLYLLNPKVVPHLTCRMSTDFLTVSRHNLLLLILIILSFALSLLSNFETIPPLILGIVGALRCFFPVPLILLIALQQTAFRMRGWLVLAAVQITGTLSVIFSVFKSQTFAIMQAVCFTLWVGGITFLFQMLCVPIGMEQVRTISPIPSEDFRSLADPFMSPRSPASIGSGQDLHRPSTHNSSSSPKGSAKHPDRGRPSSLGLPTSKVETKVERCSLEPSMDLLQRRSSRRIRSEPLLPTLLHTSLEAKTFTNITSEANRSSSDCHPRRPSTPSDWLLGCPEVMNTVRYAFRQEHFKSSFSSCHNTEMVIADKPYEHTQNGLEPFPLREDMV